MVLRQLLENYVARLRAFREASPKATSHLFQKTESGRVIIPILRAAYRAAVPTGGKVENWTESDALYDRLVFSRDGDGLSPVERAIAASLWMNREVLFSLAEESDRQKLLIWIADHGAARFGMTDEVLEHPRDVRDERARLVLAAEEAARQRQTDEQQRLEAADLQKSQLSQLVAKTSSRTWLLRRLLRLLTSGKSGLA